MYKVLLYELQYMTQVQRVVSMLVETVRDLN